MTAADAGLTSTVATPTIADIVIVAAAAIIEKVDFIVILSRSLSPQSDRASSIK
jgi:hypothetical protein